MVSYRYPIIARETWGYIGILFAVAVLLHVYVSLYAALPIWFVFTLALYICRDPRRKVPAIPLAIVAPVDGVVESISTEDDPWLQRKSIRIRIAMKAWGAYALHSPMEGMVVDSWFDTGTAHSGHRPPLTQDAKLRISHWIQSDEKDDVILSLNSTSQLWKASMKTYLQSGQRVGQGQRCGYIPMGRAWTEVLLADSVRLNVEVGDLTEAGTTVIATLVQPKIS